MDHNAPIAYFITAWLIAIAVMDFRIRKVRNWMVIVGLLVGLAVLLTDAQPFQLSVGTALLGLLAGFTTLLPLYALGWMGAGDVKFAAVVGLWVGCTPTLGLIWLGASVLAGLHSLVVLAWHRLQASGLGFWLLAHVPSWGNQAMPAPLNLQFNARNRRRSIPYAGYMAVAALALQVLPRLSLL